jgi:hypothetical protein
MWTLKAGAVRAKVWFNGQKVIGQRVTYLRVLKMLGAILAAQIPAGHLRSLGRDHMWWFSGWRYLKDGMETERY